MNVMPNTRRGIIAWSGALLAIAAGLALLIGLAGSSAASGDVAAKNAHVKIKGFAYHPTPIKVHKGTKVAFTNKDGAKHTATAKSGKWNTGKIKHGHTAVIKFKHKGTFHYHCTLHPFMKGKVIVH